MTKAKDTAYIGNFPKTLPAVGKNYLINGGFNIWQRGLTFTNPASATRTADRWVIYFDGTGGSRTILAQQLDTGLDNSVYYFQWQQPTNETGNTYRTLAQSIENVRTLAGKTVTVSFSTNCSAAGLSVHVGFQQNFGTGGSPSANVNIAEQAVTTTTNIKRHELTFNIPTLAGKTIGTNEDSRLVFYFGLPAGVTFSFLNFWDIKIEEGPVATAFESRSLGEELALCQRYYQTLGTQGSGLIIGAFNGANNFQYKNFPLVVPMRATPTVAITAVFYNNASDATCFALGPDSLRAYSKTTSTGSSWTALSITAEAEYY